MEQKIEYMPSKCLFIAPSIPTLSHGKGMDTSYGSTFTTNIHFRKKI